MKDALDELLQFHKYYSGNKEFHPYSMLDEYIMSLYQERYLRKSIDDVFRIKISVLIIKANNFINWINTYNDDSIMIETEKILKVQKEKMKVLKEQLILLKDVNYVQNLKNEIFNLIEKKDYSVSIDDLKYECKEVLKDVTINGESIVSNDEFNIKIVKKILKILTPENIRSLRKLSYSFIDYSKYVSDYCFLQQIDRNISEEICFYYICNCIKKQIIEKKQEIVSGLIGQNKKIIKYLIKIGVLENGNIKINNELMNKLCYSKKVSMDLFCQFQVVNNLQNIENDLKNNDLNNEKLSKILCQIPKEQKVKLENFVNTKLVEKNIDTSTKKDVYFVIDDIIKIFCEELIKFNKINIKKLTESLNNYITIFNSCNDDLKDLFCNSKNLNLFVVHRDTISSLNALYIVYILDLIDSNKIDDKIVIEYLEKVYDISYDVKSQTEKVINAINVSNNKGYVYDGGVENGKDDRRFIK